MSQRTLQRPAAPAGSDDRRLGLALVVIVACYAMVGIDATVVNVALPTIQDALDFSPTSLSWVFNAYTLTSGGLFLLGGRMGDVLGRRRVLMTGVAVFTLASVLAGLAGSGPWLIAARALQGAGAAMVTPNSLAMIATTFPEGPARNRALSIYSAFGGAGLSLGLLLGGVLTDVADWRWIFYVNVPLGIAIVAAAGRVLPRPARLPGRFDAPGAVLSTAGLTSGVYGFIRAAEQGWSDAGTVAALVAGVVLLAGFAVNEARHTHAVFPLRLLASRNRAFAYTLAGLVPATLFGTFFFLTEYFQDVLRYSPLRAGLAFLPMTLAMFATVRTLPRVLPRTGVRPVIVVGATLALAATAVLTRIDAGTVYLTGVLPALLLIGLGAGMCFMPLNVAVLTGVPGRDSGAATGMLQTLQWGGGSVGLAVLVTASDTAAGDPLAGLTRAFVAAGAFAVVAVGIAAFGLTRPRAGVADEPAPVPARAA